MIADFVLETVIGEFVFGFFWMTGYVLLRGVSGGRWQVRSYAWLTMDRWPTDERGIYAWVAVLVGALFWVLVAAGLLYAIIG